jgi:hypothetical protein
MSSTGVTRRRDRVLNCVPSLDTGRDWRPRAALPAVAGDAAAAAAAALPERVDLRADWWKIGDQGQTGSCVGFAAADGVLRYHFVKQGLLDQAERLSVRHLWMAAKEVDELIDRPTTFIEEAGTTVKAALDVARRYGCVREETLKFASAELYKGKTDEFYTEASALRIRGYYNLSLGVQGNSLTTWRHWLAEQGPIITRLVVDDTWWAASDTNGVLETYLAETASGGHAVTIVGYDKDHFYIRNSWGTESWGRDGFGYATKQYAGAAFNEAYGVTV